MWFTCEQMCLGAHVKSRRQFCGTDSLLLPLHIFQGSNMYTEQLYPLSHIASAILLFWYIFLINSTNWPWNHNVPSHLPQGYMQTSLGILWPIAFNSTIFCTWMLFFSSIPIGKNGYFVTQNLILLNINVDPYVCIDIYAHMDIHTHTCHQSF